MPVAMDSWRELCVKAFLSSSAVLLGPLQALTFLLNHGLLAASLGAFWSVQAHWALSVPAAALVRVAGQLAYIALTSWTLNENLFALLMSNVYSLLVRASPITRHLLRCHCSASSAISGLLQVRQCHDHGGRFHRWLWQYPAL